MTFLEALKTGRPMRRPWHSGESPWLYLGTMNVLHPRPQWRRIEDGSEVGLHRWDYEASDWEVMA